MIESWQVVVVGAGHAGCEAAAAAARLGLSTLLVTPRADRIGWMSCNPAIGGIAKGQIVREVDALGGLMARVTDETGIQFRTLNESRGPAVRGSRAQCDRALYAARMQAEISSMPRLTVLEDMVEELVLEGSERQRRVRGVRVAREGEIACEAVVLTTGTFLGGMVHIGDESIPRGRDDEPPATALSSSLASLGLSLLRFKTGTTPRLDGRTIDYERMEVQEGDEVPAPFSFRTRRPFPRLEQVPCHVTRTNPRTHALVQAKLHLSAMSRLGEQVEPTRYCPSFEDKLRRFPQRSGHIVYIEPEGLGSHEVYPAGLSMSLPADVQLEMLRTIRGLEKVEMVRPGYAIEYDLLLPSQLSRSLEVKGISGLFAAGQINGTSGYEEAAGQGIMAGINAARLLESEPPLILRRDQAYIGVLIDDLCTVGTSEPYRMFTSRAEHRLLLREDNADLRLSAVAHEVGMIDVERLREVEERAGRVRREVDILESTPVGSEARSLATALRRPGATYEGLRGLHRRNEAWLTGLDARTVEAEVQYSGYLARSRRRIDLIREMDELLIPEHFDPDALPGLSSEVREKLKAHRPATVGQAGRISGVTPAAIDILASSLARAKRGCG